MNPFDSPLVLIQLERAVPEKGTLMLTNQNISDIPLTHADLLYSRLTQREREMVHALALGLRNKQVAEKLGITTSTATTHTRNIFNKIGAHNTAHLIALLTGYTK